MIKGIHHCSVLVAELERSLAFYCDIFQLSQDFSRPDLGYPGAWLMTKDQQIHLLQLPNPDPVIGRPEPGGRDRHIAVWVDDLPQLMARLDVADISYCSSRSGRAALFCRDPDGNGIECIQQPPIPLLYAEILDLLTIRDVIRWAMSQFNQHELNFGHGTDNAFDEAVSLIFPLLKLSYNLADSYLDARLSLREKEQLQSALIQRIEKHQPVAYITQEAWFMNLKFYVDERVLIPRSPIAELIEAGFAPWLTQEPEHILDLCTGGGCIAIACAYVFPNVQIDAVDISADALAVAGHNIAAHHVESQVHLIASDLWQHVTGQYDVIVSNPPYVDLSEMMALTPEYQHEPELGLTAGVKGLDVAIPILQYAANYLKPKGILVLEVGASAEALCQYFSQIPFVWVEFEHGGEGVLVLSREQLIEYPSLG